MDWKCINGTHWSANGFTFESRLSNDNFAHTLSAADPTFSMPLRFYGRSCVSLNSSNPCMVKSLVQGNAGYREPYWTIYMANTVSKFVDSSNNDFSEGLMTYPSSGTVTLTNNGSSSILIATNLKHANFYNQSTALFLNGN